MTVAATIVVTEDAAHALAVAIDGEPALAERAVDLNERTAGRWEVAVYFESGPSEAERSALQRTALRFGERGSFEIATLPDTNWVAKSLAGLAPVCAGRFVVHGRHDRARLKGNDIGIQIEGGLAFGTGHHGTTAGCLIAIDRIARSRAIRNALDLGTGSGVLAIAIAKRTRAPVLASDIDPVAIEVARENIRINGCGRLVTVVTATGFTHPAIATRAPFDLIVANILAGPLVALAPGVRRHLAPGGVVVLSGILTSQRRRVAAAYRGRGLRFVRAVVLGEWATLVLRR